MAADVGDLSHLLHLGPEALGITHWLVGHVAREEEGAALRHDFAVEADQGHGLVRDRHAVDATLFGLGRPLRRHQVRLKEAPMFTNLSAVQINRLASA